jgi:hypothetical protein
VRKIIAISVVIAFVMGCMPAFAGSKCGEESKKSGGFFNDAYCFFDSFGKSSKTKAKKKAKTKEKKAPKKESDYIK